MKLPYLFSFIILATLPITSIFAQSQNQTAAVFENENKLKYIRIPSIEFSITPLSDALQFLQSKSFELRRTDAPRPR